MTDSPFPHQKYTAQLAPDAEVHFVDAGASPLDAEQAVKASVELARGAKVGAVVLVHGTFAGSDSMGLIRKVGRVWPTLGKSLRQRRKEWFDWLVDDAGNYTEEYAERLASLNEQQLLVERLNWSSENHHIGRADGTIRLISHLESLSRKLPDDARIQIWAHSHGGNVLALMSHLLGRDSEKREAFFRACQPYYRWPGFGRIDLPLWQEVRKLLESEWEIASRLDLVTFGTPIRYGWDRRGFGSLLHFVHHHPLGDPPHIATLPQSVDDLLQCRGGDYVQHLGIAGTNVLPDIFAWRARWADRRLNRLVQAGIRKRDLWQRIKVGARIADTGATLLVDYGPAVGNPIEDVFGHAVYTRNEWLTFHWQEVVQRLYAS